ncbi:hypothetical protein L6164_028360 [Bauhinia variegata]|uniref:Uncharacterized protein n=1 Tax=Bauhinia variegata TaxID=167791 RepID=A0ACB9LW55_BAUVA|nr:hypothetical protein L6164_028360 [Bauhinia variegata]
MASASESPKLLHLFAALVALFLLFSHSLQDPFESDLCNFEEKSQLDDLSEKVKLNENVMKEWECHSMERSGECKSEADCGHVCAALGLNPNAVRCIPTPATPTPSRCCCLVSPKQN